MSVAQIAETLNLSPSTVGTHLYHVKQKLGASNQSRADAGGAALGPDPGLSRTHDSTCVLACACEGAGACRRRRGLQA